MTVHRAQVIIPAVSATPEDAVTNTWYFNMGVGASLEGPESALKTFYEDSSAIFCNLQETTSASIKWYDMADVPPRAPVRENAFAFSGSTGNPLPTEVCICLSFEGLAASGIPQASRRGRVYLGPVNTGQADGNARIGSPQLVILQANAGDLLDKSQLAADWDWVVWSNKRSEPTEIVRGWIDNEFDTQRRRGRTATTRSTFGAATRFAPGITPAI